MAKRFKKSDIKTGYWVQLDKKPYHNTKLSVREWLDQMVESDKKLLDVPSYKRYVSKHEIRRRIKNNSESKWYKVLGTRDGLKYRDTMGLPDTFYMYWVTAIKKTKSETRGVV